MSSINGTCDSTARAQMEQYFEQLQEKRLEERLAEEREANQGLAAPALGQPIGLVSATTPASGQPTALNPETGVRNVAEPGKGQFIDLYV